MAASTFRVGAGAATGKDPAAPAEVHDTDERVDVRIDLRVALPALAGWGGALMVLAAPGRWPWLPAVGLGAGALWWLVLRCRARSAWTLAACLVAVAAVAGGAFLRLEWVGSGAVASLAEDRAVVRVVARVASDPVTRTGRYGDLVVVRLDVRRVVGRGHQHTVRTPVVVLGDPAWAAVRLGDTVATVGRLGPADDAATGGVLTGARAPQVLRRAGPVLDGAEAVRAGIRRSVAGGPAPARDLVPALVVGDDARMSPDVVGDFRTTGLTHLTAVSGTNLTLMVGFLLLVGRWLGVRARGLLVLGTLGVVGFVLVARTEPSVVRAAAMGTVALLGMGSGGRHQGVRALSVAALVLLLVDPWLAVSYGFVLSVLATAGILLLAPWFRDRMTRWTPRWLAEAVAVPLSAQLVCTPVVAVLSDQVSLVAVAANLVVAPAVAPTTVLGLVAGLVSLPLPDVGSWVGLGAAGCAWWIVAVAGWMAGLPTAAVGWPAGPLAVVVLTALCGLLVPLTGWVLGRRWATIAAAVALLVMVVLPPPTPGWPPPGWVLVACDVGQGDGLVLNAGARGAVVLDAGPEPAAIDRCLDRLDADRVDTVVLTHFHADHVGGLPGVLDGRRVGEVLVSPVAEPLDGAQAVLRWAGSWRVPVRVPEYGETDRAGPVRWQVVSPERPEPLPSEGSVANNASLVLALEVRGVRVLAAGDLEPEGQRELRENAPLLRVDVLKVPHHGSRHQELQWLTGLGARVAVVSSGADNDYGHPAPSTVTALERSGALVVRTDLAGDVALLVDDEGRLRVRAR